MALLLDLIEQNKLDISQISLADVADQYLLEIEQARDSITGDELADWLLIAAKLLVIKSRSLLPVMDLPAEEPDDLAHQLKMYKAYRDASRLVKEIIREKNFTFSRSPFKLQLAGAFSPPADLAANDLRARLAALIAELDKTIIRLPRERLARVVSLAERIADLKKILAQASSFGFKEWLRGVKNRSEVVVSFLALLELIKQRELVATQIEGEIIIKRY